MIGTYTGIFSATICLLAIQFLYRYFAVFDSTKLVYFNGWYYLAWIVYYCFFGFLWGFAVVYFFAIDDYGLRYLSKEIFEKYERNVSEIPIMALISYDEKGDIQWKCLVGLMTITAISVVQYSVISVCAFKMYDNMKEKLSSMSPLHRRIHRQFFKALLIQTFAPTVCLFSPAFFMLSVPYADLEISFPSSVFSSVFTVYPAIDSICIMTCVSEYGRCFRKLVQSMKRKYLEKPSGDKNTQIANISDTMRQTPTTPV